MSSFVDGKDSIPHSGDDKDADTVVRGSDGQPIQVGAHECYIGPHGKEGGQEPQGQQQHGRQIAVLDAPHGDGQGESALLTAVHDSDVARVEHLLAFAHYTPTPQAYEAAMGAQDGRGAMLTLLQEYDESRKSGAGKAARGDSGKPGGPHAPNPNPTLSASATAHDAVHFLFHQQREEGQAEWGDKDAEGSDGWESYQWQQRGAQESGGAGMAVLSSPPPHGAALPGTGTHGQGRVDSLAFLHPVHSGDASRAVAADLADATLSAAALSIASCLPDSTPSPWATAHGVVEDSVDLSRQTVHMEGKEEEAGSSQPMSVHAPREGEGLSGESTGGSIAFALTPAAHGSAPGSGHGGGTTEAALDRFTSPELGVFSTPNLQGVLGTSVTPLRDGPSPSPTAPPASTSMHNALQRGDWQRVEHLATMLDYRATAEDVRVAEARGAPPALLRLLRASS